MASVKGLFNRTFERLGDEQIVQLITQAQSGDVGARNRLIEAFIPMIRHIAQKYHTNRSIEEGDLVSYGVMGLMQAIETFDLSRGVKLATYATRRIHGEIKDRFRDIEGPLVWVSRIGKGRMKLWENVRDKLRVELDREPQTEEIEEASKITFQDYLESKKVVSDGIIHADHPQNGGGHHRYSYGNRWDRFGLEARHFGFDFADNKDFIYFLMSNGGLTEMEKDIIKLQYGFREPTEEEWQRIVNGRPDAPKRRSKSVPEHRSFLNCLNIGYVLNLSESRICQLESRALEKMKRALERMDSPNRKILTRYLADLQEQERRKREPVNNRNNSQLPYTKPITQQTEIPLLEVDIKPDTNDGYKRKSGCRQPAPDGFYMVRIEDRRDSYFFTEREIRDHIRNLFLYVGVKPDKIQIYRKLDFVIDAKVELTSV